MSVISEAKTQSELTRKLSKFSKDYIIILAILLLVLIFSVFSPFFFTFVNLRNILMQTSAIGIVAIGQGMIILSGDFDLSLGQNVCMTSALAAWLMKFQEVDPWLSLTIGLAAGIISGMGIGGGAILIPALTLFMQIEQQKAQNINLLYFLPTAFFALFVHKKEGNIETDGLLTLILFGMPAAIVGAFIAVNINSVYLRKGFAIFLLCMAVYELWKGFSKWKLRNLKH